LVVLILLALGGVVYGKSFIQDFLSNWLATFLGVIIDVPVALVVSNYEEKINEQTRRYRILNLLQTELTYDLDHLASWDDE
jgi:uncharacterized membrane protein YgaE (UPF0421/DUF939 family)